MRSGVFVAVWPLATTEARPALVSSPAGYSPAFHLKAKRLGSEGWLTNSDRGGPVATAVVQFRQGSKFRQGSANSDRGLPTPETLHQNAKALGSGGWWPLPQGSEA